MSPHLAGWLMIATGSAIVLGTAALVVSLRRRQAREDREWAAQAAERVNAAEYLIWLEAEFIAMDAGEIQ